jgi:hypothetical protein
MAKSWSGFVPQNESIKAQWLVLEASQAQVEQLLEGMSNEPAKENLDEDEEQAIRKVLKLT